MFQTGIKLLVILKTRVARIAPTVLATFGEPLNGVSASRVVGDLAGFFFEVENDCLRVHEAENQRGR